MTVSPGCTARRSCTSSARTGTCSVELGKTFGNIVDPPLCVGCCNAPGVAVPDLCVVVDADHDGLELDLGALRQVGREHDAALRVELGDGRVGEVGAAHEARLLADRIDPGDAGADRALVLGDRVGLEAAVL